jgi:hypothetical protein
MGVPQGTAFQVPSNEYFRTTLIYVIFLAGAFRCTANLGLPFSKKEI